MPHIFFENLEKRRNTQTLVPFSSFNNLENLEQQMGLSVHNQIYDPDTIFSPFIPYVDNPYTYMVSYYGIGVPYESPWVYPQMIPWDSWSSQWNSPWPSSRAFPWDYIQNHDRSANWLSNAVSNLFSLKSPLSSSSSPYSEPNISLPDTDPIPDPDPWVPNPDAIFGPSYTPGTWYGLIKRSNLLKV